VGREHWIWFVVLMTIEDRFAATLAKHFTVLPLGQHGQRFGSLCSGGSTMHRVVVARISPHGITGGVIAWFGGTRNLVGVLVLFLVTERIISRSLRGA
jgi:hypothetical protein